MNIEFTGITTIPARPGRKALVVYLHSGYCAFGWGDRNAGSPGIADHDETETDAPTGIPLPEAEMVTFMAETNPVFQEQMYLKTRTGETVTVTYQEKF